MQAAADSLGKTLLDQITVTIQVGWNENNGQPIDRNQGISTGIYATAASAKYDQLAAALKQNASANGYAYVAANLPATDPTQGGTFQVGQAQAKVLGLSTMDNPIDGSVGFASDAPWCFDTTSGIGANQYDFVGVAIHEITHAIGRINYSSYDFYGKTSLQPFNLYDYAAPGQLQLQNGGPAYFSIDGGKTNLNNFDVQNDIADWDASVKLDSFGEGGAGTLLGVTNTDLLALAAMGYHVALTSTPDLTTPATRTVQGGSGIDTVSYHGNFSDYKMTVSANNVVQIQDSVAGRDGTDTLTSIERLKFADKSVALDMAPNQSAGGTALLIGAVLPVTLAFGASKQALLGSVIGLFDAGYSLKDLSGAILRLPIWDILAGVSDNTHIAQYLLTNVNGHAPDQATLAAAVDALNSESFHGDWLATLAASTANQTHVGLVGLTQSGLTYA
jgi:hypothetical protein